MWDVPFSAPLFRPPAGWQRLRFRIGVNPERGQKIMRLSCVLVMCLYMLAPSLAQEAPTTAPSVPAETILFEKPIDDSRKIVVVKTAPVPASVFHEFARPNSLPGQYRLVVRLELHAAAHPPLVVWSKWYTVRNMEEYNRYRVGSMLVLPPRIIWVLYTSTPAPRIIDTNVIAGTRIAHLSPEYALSMSWSPDSAPDRIEVAAKHDAQRDAVSLVVTDRHAGRIRESRYQQKADAWEFEIVSRRQNDGGPNAQWRDLRPDQP